MVRMAEAAFQNRVVYRKVLDLVTRGIVKGERDGAGKWWACPEDLRRWKAEQREHSAEPTAV